MEQLIPLFVLFAFLAIRAAQNIALRIRGGAIAHDPDMRARGGTAILPTGVRLWLTWAGQPFLQLLLRMRLTPNAISWASLVTTCAGAGFLASGRMLVAGQVLLFGALLDHFDGRVARARGCSSKAGSFLDAVFDRVGEGGVLLASALLLSQSTGLIACVVLLVASNLVSYARAKSEALGYDLRGGHMQRGERAVALVVGALADGSYDVVYGETAQFSPFLGPTHQIYGTMVWAVAVATSMTAISRVYRGYGALGDDSKK